MLQDDIFRTIFKTSFDSSDVYLLKQVTEEYPYFSLAHFFKLKKDTVYDENSAAKTALHFHNPFLLNFRLNNSENGQAIKPVEIIAQREKEEIIHEEPTPMSNTAYLANIDEPFVGQGLEVVKKFHYSNEMLHPIPEKSARLQENAGIPVVEGALQNLLDKNSFLKHEEELAPPNVPNKATPENKEPAMPEKKGINEPEVAIQQQALPQEWLFEPLHTTDYFASQGIKITEDTAGSDKLGKQLKSFTEWLKIMKKQSHYKVSPDAPVDHAVENLAEKSNEEQEIITETMAEAYKTQGKSEKAREIYQKLSLLNPSKSAYFAAQIEYLKDN